MAPSQFFSNHGYSDNQTLAFHTKRLFWAKTNPEFTTLERFSYCEVIMHDLYHASCHWFSIFKNAEWWREGLE